MSEEIRKARGLAPQTPLKELENRLARAKELMRSRDIDVLLIYGSSWYPEYIRYLANYVNPYRGAESFLMIFRVSDSILFVSEPWYFEHAKEMSRIRDVRHSSDLLKTLAEFRFNTGTVGLPEHALPIAYYRHLRERFPKVRFVDNGELLESLIALKSRYDKGMIRQAATIAERGIRVALSSCAEGKKEFEVGLNAEKVMVESGAEVGASSVYPYVFVGSGSAIKANIRSYNYTRKKFRKGEMFFIDLSLLFNGYYADLCRTVVIGRPTAAQQGLFEVVKCIHEALMKSIRTGSSGAEIYGTGYAIAKEFGYENDINGFGVGHGIGTKLVEGPLFIPHEQRAITPGRFYNIEPGVFLPPIGSADVEDMLYFDEHAQLVTRFDRELRVA